MMNKQGKKVGTGMIVSVVIGILMLTVLFSILPDTIPTATTAVHNLSDSLNAQSAVIGTGASTFAGNLDSLTGWFWVIGPLVLVIVFVTGMFLQGGKGGYRRRRRY